MEYALQFTFKASNNEAEYEALIFGLKLVEAMKIDDLATYNDLQLIVKQVTREYEAKDPRMTKYLKRTKNLISKL